MCAHSSTADQWDSAFHAPVLVADVVSLLAGAAHVLDGTLGGGGHSLALLQTGARVDALDRDPAAVATARERLAAFERAGRFRAHLANYASIDDVSALKDARFNGILLDLGISSHQIDTPERGFSFREGARLDMRMGADARADAATLLNAASASELTMLFRRYADEPRAARLAREIARRRQRQPFATSDDLVRAIRGALGPRTGPSDFARLFQAVRVAVNDELADLERALPALRERLLPGGTLIVIAYHSGEDRLVKRAMRDWSASCVCPPKQLTCTCRGTSLGAQVHRRPLSPAVEEIERNPRARSARLRAWRSAA